MYSKVITVKALPCIHIFAAVFLINTGSSGQVTINYTEQLSVEEGLTNNWINDVIQDSKGFLWIATSYGLNRYDGENVVHYVHNNISSSISSDMVKCLLESDSNHLYVGTGSGIAIVNLDNYLFKTVHLAATVPGHEYDDQIEFLNRDHSGNIWATTASMIYRLDKNLEILDKFRTQKDPVKSRKSNVLKMESLPSGEVLFWLYNGLYLWSPGNQGLHLLSEVKSSKLQFLVGSTFNSITLADSRFLVYLSGHNIISILDMRTGQFRRTELSHTKISLLQFTAGSMGDTVSITTEKGGFILYKVVEGKNGPALEAISNVVLQGNEVKQVFHDNEGNYWAAPAAGGLLKMAAQKQVFNFRNLDTSRNMSSENFEISCFFPLEKSILIGSFGGGFYHYDPASDKIEQHTIRIGANSENMVWNIWRCHRDTLWLGTQQGLIWCCLRNYHMGRIRILHPAVIDKYAITTLFEDSRGLVWMGIGNGNGVVVYDKHLRTFRWYKFEPGSYPYRYPKRVLEDGKTDLWFVSDPTGNLVKWNRSRGAFEKIIVPGIQGELDLESDGFYFDKEQNEIWFGVKSGRLIEYNITTKKSVVYGVRDGYTSGAIMGIQIDKSGRLWLGSAQGISCFDRKKKQFMNFFRRNGLPASYFSSSLYFDTATDNLYAGAPGRFIWFDTRRIRRLATPLKIQVTDVVVNNKNVERINTPWVFDADQNNIRINFTGVNLSNGEENIYEYRTNDGQWISLERQNEINFASLNPGKYTISIRGSRRDDYFDGPVTQLAFTIKPRFTETIWFFILCFLAGFALVYAWYRHRIGYLRKVEQMRAHISRDLHDEIGSRLTNISMMSMVAAQKSSGDFKQKKWLEKINEESQAVSQSMREIVWHINPENDSLDEAFPRMLRYTTDLLEAKGIEVAAYLPDSIGTKMDMEKRRDLFLIFKETIQNIMKHANARKVIICLETRDSLMHLKVSDDGKGFERKNLAFLNGLEYMRQRANHHGWDFEVNSTEGAGTTINLRIRSN